MQHLAWNSHFAMAFWIRWPANKSSLIPGLILDLSTEARWWHLSWPFNRKINKQAKWFSNLSVIWLNSCPFQQCWNLAMNQNIQSCESPLSCLVRILFPPNLDRFGFTNTDKDQRIIKKVTVNSTAPLSCKRVLLQRQQVITVFTSPFETLHNL